MSTAYLFFFNISDIAFAMYLSSSTSKIRILYRLCNLIFHYVNIKEAYIIPLTLMSLTLFADRCRQVFHRRLMSCGSFAVRVCFDVETVRRSINPYKNLPESGRLHLTVH